MLISTYIVKPRTVGDLKQGRTTSTLAEPEMYQGRLEWMKLRGNPVENHYVIPS